MCRVKRHIMNPKHLHLTLDRTVTVRSRVIHCKDNRVLVTYLNTLLLH
jgi:hypothetical protein